MLSVTAAVAASFYSTQGCLLVNLLCASKPEYNSKFSVLALMAPVFFAQHVQQPFFRMGATYKFDEVSPLQPPPLPTPQT